MKNYFLLFAKLPVELRLVWGMMLLGWPLGFGGMLLRSEWAEWTGGGLLIAGFALAVADFRLRQRNRELAESFHFNLLIGAVTGVLVMAFVSVLCLATFVVIGMIHGFSLAFGLRLLAFMGLLYAGGIISTIARERQWTGVKQGLSRP